MNAIRITAHNTGLHGMDENQNQWLRFFNVDM